MEPVQQLQNLINQRRYQDVFDLCESFLEAGSLDASEVFRMRAYAHAMNENYSSAIEDMQRVVDHGTASISDYFLAATWALYLPDLEKSDVFLHKVQEEGEASGNTWFRSSAYFYSAYIEMERSDLSSAMKIIEILEESDSEIALPLPGIGMTSLKQLRMETQRRDNGR